MSLWQAGNAFEIQRNSIVQRASNLLERAALHRDVEIEADRFPVSVAAGRVAVQHAHLPIFLAHRRTVQSGRALPNHIARRKCCSAACQRRRQTSPDGGAEVGQVSGILYPRIASLFGLREPLLRAACAFLHSRRARRRSRRPEGHRVAARSVLDGREHDGTLTAAGRRGNSPDRRSSRRGRQQRGMRLFAVWARISPASGTFLTVGIG